jgi:uncharacterized membrane protein HdeD (DUF308 family)
MQKTKNKGAPIMLEKIKKFGWGYILLFLLLLAVGVCLIAFNNTLEIVAVVCGVIMILFGIIYFVLTLAAKSRGVKYALKITVCAVALICGVVTAIFRNGAIEIIVSLLALFLIIDGAFKLQTTALSKRYSLAIWWLILIPACLTIIGGFVAMRISPSVSDNLPLISILLGISAIIDGAANLLSAFYIAKYESVMKEEIIDEYLLEKEADEDASKE